MRRIWTLSVRNIHQTFLLGDRKQTAFVARLQAAHQAVGDRVPPEAAEVLNDWLRRRAQLCDPPAPDDKCVAVLEAARRRRGRRRWVGLLLGMLLAAGLVGAALRLALR